MLSHISMVVSEKPLLQAEDLKLDRHQAQHSHKVEGSPSSTDWTGLAQRSASARIALLVAALLLLSSLAVLIFPPQGQTPPSTTRTPALRNGDLRAAQLKMTELASTLRVPLSARSDPDSRFFIWLADIHADPYYGTAQQECHKHPVDVTLRHPFGVVGCDPPPLLMEEAVAEAVAVLQREGVKAEFVVHSGDLVRHLTEEMPDPAGNVSGTVRSMAGLITSSFKMEASHFVLTPMGNTDTPADYLLKINESEAENPWLTRLAQDFVDAGALGKHCRPTYNFGGYCSWDMGGGMLFLSLDTLIYSKFHNPAPDPLLADPFDQFDWLRQQLRLAQEQKRKVWILGHIPPGIETYGFTELWHPMYVAKYLEIVTDAALGQGIAAQLYGHVHADEFRIVPGAPAGAGPMLLTGALSPIYFNNPSFRLMEYSHSTGELKNMHVYWAELPPLNASTSTKAGNSPLQWQFGYDLQAAYSPLADAAAQGGVTQEAYSLLLANFLKQGGESSELKEYSTWYKTKMGSDLLDCVDAMGAHKAGQKCFHAYACGVVVSNQSHYDACIASEGAGRDGASGTRRLQRHGQ
mmetsp:Transcript_66920/g.160246  ORF Transcript_66920/g.160246 Transcript_66920/m.160246 type:complete len:578 (-) Transcript_66920:184-1917(-)